MNINDIKMKYPGFYYYQMDNFANITLVFKFNINENKEDLVKSYILCDYLNQTNKKYQTLKDINNKCRDLYASDYEVFTTNRGQKNYIEFKFTMLDYKIIEDNFFRDAINFFKDIMFEPNFNGDKLDTALFEKIKQELYDSEKEKSYEPRFMEHRIFLQNLIPNSNLIKERIKDLPDLVEVLSKIKEQDIVNFYYEIINNFARGYIFGNLSDNEIDYIAKCFNFKKTNFDNNYFVKEQISEGEKTVISKETSQSYLYVVYDILNNKLDENYIFRVILNILNSSSGLVFKVLREELGLVYSANADMYSMRGFMFIKAKIDKKNKDKCLEGINEIIRRLHDKKIVGDLLKYYKELVNDRAYTNKENYNYYLNNLNHYVFEEEMEEEKEIELINKLTAEDIIKYVNKLEKKYIFFYQGDKDEK